jgi:two-component system CheB/CheR fusion protein
MISDVLEEAGWTVEAFESCEGFLDAYSRHPGGCILLDIHFPGMSGLQLLERIEGMADAPPVIMVSGTTEISDAVRSMRGGALDFLEKPVVQETLLGSVRKALSRSRRSDQIRALRDLALLRLGDLTERQRQVMELVLEGQPSKNIAADLGISQRTVESHRASIMQRTGSASLPALARMVMCNACPMVK